MNSGSALIEILKEETEAHQELLELKHREQREIVGGKIENLIDTVLAIGNAVDRIKDLEASRESVTFTFGTELGIAFAKSPTLSELVAAMPRKEGKELLAVGEELKTIAGMIRKVNNESRHLVTQSLDWMNSLFSQVTGESASMSIYDAQGERTTASAGSVLVNKTL